MKAAEIKELQWRNAQLAVKVDDLSWQLQDERSRHEGTKQQLTLALECVKGLDVNVQVVPRLVHSHEADSWE